MEMMKRCVASFKTPRNECDTSIVCIYNGNDERVESQVIASNTFIIGFEQSEYMATEMARLAKYHKEYLFGNTLYNRSYGGGSNLILAAAATIGANRILKVDQDCMDHTNQSKSWLSNACKIPNRTDTIYYGGYLEERRNYSSFMPRKTLTTLIGYVYPEVERQDRLHTHLHHKSCNVVKNGNLVIPLRAAESACYPVLYFPKCKIHARGEVNYWVRTLRRLGFSFKFSPSLKLNHKFDERSDVTSWISSLLLAYDLSYIDRKFNDSGIIPRENERRDRLLEFRDWLRLADWGDKVNVDALLQAVTEEDAFEFSEQTFFRREEQNMAWKILMTTDKTYVARNILCRY